MLKPELVEKVAAASKQPKAVVDEVIGATLEAITAALRKGESVRLVGFGTFEVRSRAARVREVPKGFGATERVKVRVPATKVAAFKAGALLKQAVTHKRK